MQIETYATGEWNQGKSADELHRLNIGKSDTDGQARYHYNIETMKQAEITTTEWSAAGRFTPHHAELDSRQHFQALIGDREIQHNKTEVAVERPLDLTVSR